MNQRIEELSKEAWRQIDVGKIRGRHRAYTKIFAELIIRDCTELFPERHYHYSGLAVAKNIKKHFEVEE
jgi:hypothetical protein